jgi:membrane protein DedA with SNARE-associated domain
MSWWLLLIIVFAAPLVDSFVPVLPGEVVVAGAATSLYGGALPIPAVVAGAAAGSLVGECLVAAVARRMAATRRGERLVGGPKSARIRRLFDRWGVGAVIVARFLPGGRSAAAAAFALRSNPRAGFVAAAAVGSSLWAAYLVTLGSGVAAAI